MNRYFHFLLLTWVCGYWSWQSAMAQDSIRIIPDVTVDYFNKYAETIKPQELKGEALAKVNAHSVADALRFMNGVLLKDYGGLGGLKTVNLRSLGSQHVGIYYDGVELGNAQNGVIDLGQFSLDNVECIRLYQGQRSSIIQTASDFANAGSIYIQTRTPELANKSHAFRSKVQYGACNTLRWAGLWEQRLTTDLTLSTHIEALSSNGRYKFNYRRRNLDGTLAYDTTAVRQNGDILSVKAEVNLHGKQAQGFYDLKVYTYHSQRGIPGAIVNNVWRRGERQGDHNTFVQGQWHRDVTDRYTLRAHAKYAYYQTHYRNRDTTQLMIDQHYRQQELYWNLIQVYEITPKWSISNSYDGRLNTLEADTWNCPSPIRWSYLGSIATAYNGGKLRMQGSLVYSYIHDQVESGSNGGSHSHLTPAWFVYYAPTDWLSFSGFLKQSYRMPTFNDLYYTEIGNAMLRPERALQEDLGIEIGKTDLDYSWKLSAHAYHNSVSDKIVAYPKGQQFRWTMLNLGKIHIDGIDLQSEASYKATTDLELSGRLQYTYQRAVDVTNASDSFYRHQIPYTPWHSGSATLSADWKEFCLAYNFVYTGERYSQQENIRYNHLQPWYTSDLHLSWRKNGCQWTLEANNLLNQQYDVIINYPMPGRNFNLTWQYEFQ